MTALATRSPLPGQPAARRHPAAPVPLAHCVWLAALLHVWLALLLGSAPAGTARPGEGVWGAINITLRGDVDGRVSPSPLPPVAPVPAQGPVGAAADPRWGGSVRPLPAPQLAPGAATLGRWAPAAQAVDQPPVIQDAPDDQPSAPPPLPGRVAQERAAPEPAPLPPAAAPEVEAQPPALRRIAPLPLPAVAPVAAPMARSGPLPSAVTNALAAPLALPNAVPIAEPLPPPAPEAPTAPALRQMGQMGQTAPAAPARQAALPRVDASTSLSVPQGLPAPLAAGPGPRAPDAGPQVGHDIATLPAQPASSPRLNLDLPRLRGGELSRYATTGLLPVLPRPPEQSDKLGQEIGKTAKPDCRNAYGGLGVLAVVPLAVDAVRSGGCKW